MTIPNAPIGSIPGPQALIEALATHDADAIDDVDYPKASRRGPVHSNIAPQRSIRTEVS